MDDAHDAEPEHSPYVRLPWPLVAGGLVGLLLLALAAGLLANRYLRPQREPLSTQIALVTATLVAASTVPPTPAPTLPSLAATEPQADGAQLPTRTPPASAQLLPSPTPVIPTSVATTREPLSPELAAEIDDAYQHYWQIRAEALLDLDSSRLSEVMAGDHLVAIEKLIGELRAEGHALLTNVDHQYGILSASTDDAQIADTYIDSSVYVDVISHEVMSQAANETLHEQYRLTKIDGSWRVVSLVRAP